MNKIDLLKGFVLGIIASLIGSYIFIFFGTEYTYLVGVQILKSQGSLGKLITLGSILDIVLFFVLLKMNKELVARGVVLSVIVLAMITIFV